MSPSSALLRELRGINAVQAAKAAESASPAILELHVQLAVFDCVDGPYVDAITKLANTNSSENPWATLIEMCYENGDQLKGGPIAAIRERRPGSLGGFEAFLGSKHSGRSARRYSRLHHLFLAGSCMQCYSSLWMIREKPPPLQNVVLRSSRPCASGSRPKNS